MTNMEWIPLFNILLAWAVQLSPYQPPNPSDYPSIFCVEHAFIVENACFGRQCSLDGWYNNESIIYLSTRQNPGCDIDRPGADGLLVHEFVHFLQDINSPSSDYDCQETMRREREAYRIQSDYMRIIHGVLGPKRLPAMSCG